MHLKKKLNYYANNIFFINNELIKLKEGVLILRQKGIKQKHNKQK